MIHADYLFLLTDVDGLYTANPRKDPKAKLIEVVTSVTAIRSQGKLKRTGSTHPLTPYLDAVSTTTLGSSLGTGGMETKLIAAEVATAAGVTTIITSSKHPENIFSIIEYHQHNSPKIYSAPSTPQEPFSNSLSLSAVKRDKDLDEGRTTGDSSPILPRPPHTTFTASPMPLRDLKSWTSHTLFPAGSVIIDAGAHLVLSRRESGGRLLAVGVRGVIGAFASGQAVRICIRKGDFVSSLSQEAAREKYAKGLGLTRPNSPTVHYISDSRLTETTSDEPTGTRDLPASEDDVVLVDKNPDYTEVDLVEVGRGLANYNSAQIARVKGLNRYSCSRLPSFSHGSNQTLQFIVNTGVGLCRLGVCG